MKRVGAIAVVHEILSQAFDTSVKFDDVADRLLRMVVDVAATGEPVHLRREGTFGYVPADVATRRYLRTGKPRFPGVVANGTRNPCVRRLH